MRLIACALLVGNCGIWLVSDLPSRSTLLFTGLMCLSLILLTYLIGLLVIRKLRLSANNCSVETITARFNLTRLAFTFLLIAGFAFCYAAWVATEQLSHRLLVSSERMLASVEGQVCSPVRQSDERISLVLCSIKTNDIELSRLGLRKIQLSAFYLENIPEPGKWYVFDVRLKTPYSMRNPSVFDYERYALVNRIDAVGYFTHFTPLPDADTRFSVLEALKSLRLQQMESFSRRLGETSFPGWHMALTYGERHLLTTQQRELLIDSGTAHLIAISGLHIGLVFFWSYFIFRFIWARSRKLIQLLPAHTAGQIAGLCLSATFAMLSGFDLPSQRALIAISVFLAAQYLLLNWSSTQLLACTLTIILLTQPLSVLSEGFWLSVIAVAFIFAFVSSQKANSILLWLKLQCFLSAGMSLVSGLLFGLFSVNAFLTNLFAIPIISFWVLPLDILALICHFLEPIYLMHKFSNFFLWVSDWGISIVESGLYLFTELFPALFISSFHAALGLFCLLAVYLIMVLRSKLLAFTLSIQALILVLSIYITKVESGVRLQFLDVGQGSSIIGTIYHQSGDFHFIYDTGFANAHYSTVESVLNPILTEHQVEKLDLLIISHDNQDHSGDYEELLRSYQVDRLILGELDSTENKLAVRGSDDRASSPHIQTEKLNHFSKRAERCLGELELEEGIKLSWFSANTLTSKTKLSSPNKLSSRINLSSANKLSSTKELFINSPEKSQTTQGRNQEFYSGNNASCLLRLDYFEHSVLLTGDIELEAEQKLIELAPEQLTADILSVPHHGSTTSSSWSFIAQVSPQLAVVNAGYLNRFKHPRTEIIERYASFNAQVLNTAETGRILVTLESNQLPSLQWFRDTDRHFWNH